MIISLTTVTRFAHLSKTLEKPNSWLTGNKSPFTALQHLASPAEAQAASYFHCIMPFPEAINSECHISSNSIRARIFTTDWLRLGSAVEKWYSRGLAYSEVRRGVCFPLLLSSWSQETAAESREQVYLFLMLAVKMLYEKTRGITSKSRTASICRRNCFFLQHTVLLSEFRVWEY